MNLSAAADEDAGPPDEVIAEINMTPLTDVFLVLLIIAIVTATSMVERPTVGLEVTAARGRSAGKPAPVLTVGRTGGTSLDRIPVARDALEAAIRKALGDRDTDTILVRGDPGAPLGAAVQAMSVARKAGARNIQVIAAPPSP